MEDALRFYEGTVFITAPGKSCCHGVMLTFICNFPKLKLSSPCAIDIRSDGAALLRDACGVLGSKGNCAGVFNSLPWERHEVIHIQDGAGKPDLGM